jgi:hypothetical protein
VAGLFFGGAIGLFHRQFASGELYPEFSSFRTDPKGSKLLYDSLSQLPGMIVERNFLPLEFLPRDGATLVLLGVNPATVNWNQNQFLLQAERIARRGNRLLVAMHYAPEDSDITQKDLEQRPSERRNEPPKSSKAKVESPYPPLHDLWGVRLQVENVESKEKPPVHPLFFAQAEGWKVLDEAGSKTLAIERAFDKGSIVLMAESADFTNQSAVAMNRLQRVSDFLGTPNRIVFDEQHLGIAESGSVVGMARQFRLTGFALGLAICAALFIWRNASSFPPPAVSQVVERFAGRTSHTGLLTLLRRNIPPADLATVCWREWLSTNGRQATPELRKRAETILTGSATRPVEATREIQTLLRVKGEL